MKNKRLYLALIAAAAFVVAGCNRSTAESSETTAAQSAESDSLWTQDYQAALTKAQAEDKQLLLNFTGSDWCPWCIRMDEDVLSKQAFKDYAKDNLVLVTVDFPRGKELPEEVKQQNEQLQDRFGVQGLPTFVLLDAQGNEVKRWEGYVKGGPEVFVTALGEQKKG